MGDAAPTRRTRTPDVLAEIGAKGDFPAAAKVIKNLRDAVARENCTALDVARAVLQDPGLASKVLRLVNSAFYRKAGQTVSTITRAVIVLGFESIRDLTAGILLIDELVKQSRSSATLREELRRSLLCGTVARRLSLQVGYPTSEEAYLLGLFANWGLLWLAAYYPAELEEARRLECERGVPFEEAVRKVCGIRTADLSAAILERWNFPATFAAFFKEPGPSDRASVVGTAAKLSAIVHVAADYARTAEAGAEKSEGALHRYQALFGLGPEHFVAMTQVARDEVREQAALLGLAPPPRDPVRPAATSTAREDATPATAARPAEAARAARAVRPAPSIAGDGRVALEILAEISRATVEQDDINHVLFMVLEGIARAGGYDAVFLALLSVKQDRIVGRLGHGEGVEQYLSELAVPLRPDAGVLATTVLSRTPTIMPEGSPAQFVPAGAPVPHIPAASYVAHPLTVRGKTVGLLVATRAEGPPVSAADLPLLELFCNQASVALAQCAG